MKTKLKTTVITLIYASTRLQRNALEFHHPMPELCYEFQGVLCSIYGHANSFTLALQGLQFILLCQITQLCRISLERCLRLINHCVSVCAMWFKETLPLTRCLYYFLQHRSKSWSSFINFSALASSGCLVEWCTIVAARKGKQFT